MKTITFITTGQPATNPRLIKEAELLSSLGYKVNVIYSFYQSWANDFDKEIIGRSSVNYILCGGDPDNTNATYWLSRLRQKIAFKLFGLIKSNAIAENAISRTHTEALDIAKKIKSDIYIAHNLGALPAAILAAKHNNAKIGYDAEDIHSGQYNSFREKGYLLNKYIEEKYFADTDYFTAASPLIAQKYRETYPYLNPITINNVFPLTEIPQRQSKQTGGPLKLFWFSQTIGTDRGLEEVIRAMGLLNKEIELHLLGSCTSTFRDTLNNLALQNGLSKNQINLHKPVSPQLLPAFAARFDVGLATETGTTLNRNICLTNKIFVYIQCGLPIIASDTQAQLQFIETYPNSGLSYQKGDANSLADCINAFYTDRKLLEAKSIDNYKLGQDTLNWENESGLFLKVFNTLTP